MKNIDVELPFSDLKFMDLLGLYQGSSPYTPPIQISATPNSSSISSPPSDEAVYGKEKKINNEDEDEKEDGEEQPKRNKRFKSTKSSVQLKKRVPKVSFITQSDVDHLDDGYKWNKYGQKPVKNSPFPRHNYRCKTAWCDVKKRVERSSNDPFSVITSYVGQHTHPRPLIIMSKNRNFGFNASASAVHQLFDYNNHQQQQEVDGAGLVKDHGLLQDVVSSHIIKERH